MIGQQIGPYEVLSKLGEGGMGEVYRARDTRLGRDVALKVLPPFLASDSERLARFRREAQVLAALNHPNIGHIYGFEDSGTTPALVLELVEGPTLADRIARGPIPLADALAIARQICDALEAAHEHGVIHRDLKPANIKLKGDWDAGDGTVKVLDFGLAKIHETAATTSDAGTHAATMTSPAMTQMGVILGTAAYMAPEQAKGRAADRRSDVWAFGVVLFEMIAGRQVFTGETVSEVMASVLKEEPDWSLLPSGLSSSLRRVLRRCLEKDPKKRLSAMGDVRIELTDADTDAPAPPASGAAARTSRLALAVSAAAGAIVAAVGFTILGGAPASAPPPQPSRVTVLGPDGVTLSFDAAESSISPDGRALAFSAADRDGRTRLWVRTLESLNATVLAGTETATLPFWSPDSRQIGFFAGGKLKKIPAAGGTVEELCDAKDGRGGTWGSQNVIVFAPSNAGPLMSVSGHGGEPKPATTLDEPRGETGHRFPSFLPDGRHFVFATLPMKSLQYDLFIGAIDDASRVPVGSGEGAAIYAEPGYLIFPRKGVLFAQPLDAAATRLTGEPIAIGDAPGATGAQWSAGRSASASTTGTLAYLGDRLPDTALVWLNRSGRETGTLPVPDGRYQEIAIAPDGTRAAITRFITQNDSDIWIADLARGGATRFTTERALNFDIVWSPDSRRIVFAADVAGPRDLFIKPASGAAPETPLYASPVLFKDSRAWSPDGSVVMFEQLDPKTQRDLWTVPAGGGEPVPYLRTPYNESFPVFSPDGNWIAYASDESGRFEIYIDSFPEPRQKYKVTHDGAWFASWRGDGRELAFTSADLRSVKAVAVSLTPTLSTGTPVKLFDFPRQPAALGFARDHERVLVALPISETTTSRITLIFDWVGLLSRK